MTVNGTRDGFVVRSGRRVAERLHGVRVLAYESV